MHGGGVELNLLPGNAAVTCNSYKALRCPSLGAQGKEDRSLQPEFSTILLLSTFCSGVGIGEALCLPGGSVGKEDVSPTSFAQLRVACGQWLKGTGESHRESGPLDQRRPAGVCLTGTLRGLLLGGAAGS